MTKAKRISVKMSWGEELWDKYPDLMHHTQAGIDFLENFVGNLMKDRAKVEAEYAKSLRALVKKYTPKESGRPPQEQFTHVRAYKQVEKKLQIFYLKMTLLGLVKWFTLLGGNWIIHDSS